MGRRGNRGVKLKENQPDAFQEQIRVPGTIQVLLPWLRELKSLEECLKWEIRGTSPNDIL